ncbi:MAG TPA: methyltransferase [Oleiagrimonas sp.]|nr:methyltransferase [Oleiagrimonas sp.]
MYKTVVAGSLALLLCACGSSQPPATTTASSASTPAAATSAPFATDQPNEMVPPRSAAQLSADMLHKVLSSPARDKAARALDAQRHPARTLAFFGLRPDMNVIEVAPGDGWYAAILAPLLEQDGTYTATTVSPLASKQAGVVMQALRKTFDGDRGHFGRARLASFDPHTPNLGTPGSADMVLSFRDVHVWVAKGTAGTMFRAIHDVLKPGGVFGVVDNRAPADADLDDFKGTPCLRQADVIKLAVRAGFKLAEASDINANPADEGCGKQVGADADRMTLRFVKPAKPAHAQSA